MKTYLDCIPCFFKQALELSRLSGANIKTQRYILNDVAKAIPNFLLEASPPEMGRIIYNLIKKHIGENDPYLKIKEKSNQFALKLNDQIVNKLKQNHDRLLTAVEMAIAGNIIDYGVKNRLDVNMELEKILNSNNKSTHNRKFFQYDEFERALKKARTILYLADNAGETVFDRILMEEIKSTDPEKEIIYAVKEKPIINDALEKDALDCGIDRIARIMSSGSDAPGTILSLCSDDFLEVYKSADMVISKGQGNFESLSNTKRSIFFLLIAKCPVIAKDIKCQVGDIILLYKN